MNSMKSKEHGTGVGDTIISFELIRLKRRLEQYEHDRQIERAHTNRLQAKREADIEARLRKDRV